jgi:uncharacterized caspase-like protein
LFKSAHFEAVRLALDLGIADLRRAISEFADLASDADIAVVYYAGHGIEMDGTNYLIPIDARFARDFELMMRALRSTAYFEQWNQRIAYGSLSSMPAATTLLEIR